MTDAMRILKALYELGATEGTGKWVTKKEIGKVSCAQAMPHAVLEYPDRFAFTMWATLVDGFVSIKRENCRLLLRLTPFGELKVINQNKQGE